MSGEDEGPGPEQAGPEQAGPEQAGPEQAGPEQTGPHGTGASGKPGPSEDRTVFIPAQPAAVVEPLPPPPSQPPYSAPSSAHPGTSFSQPAPAFGEARPIRPGDVLNHIFEVRRFIARGGMGEVFEGINVNSEERVAIKVILPHLAADPAVQAMFRKEARTLTRISHPALVQYRVLAQEPQLGVFYIVTEFIEGQNLSDVLRDVEASPAQLASLTKRLAEGLAAAHALGAIHRDISPDNVMFEEGRFDLAKIIDFGIAKDIDPGAGTIIGDGFAGKLNYVAPEQLGDFDRSVGPWTDVYSLGLVILAVAQRKDVNMGGSLVDAVDKRRAGPDLSPLPPELRPVLERMLKPNPAERARSMEDVLALLANPATASLAATAPLAAPVAPRKPFLPSFARRKRSPEERAERAERLRGHFAAARKSRLALIGGGLGLIALIALVWVFSGSTPKPDQPAAAIADAGPAVPGLSKADTARQVLATGLSTVPCTWLDTAAIDDTGGRLALAFRGVAGKPAEAQGQIGQMLRGKGLQAASIDFDDVSPISPRECGLLEAFGQVRATGQSRLTVPQRKFEMVKLPDSVGADAGKLGAQAVIVLDLHNLPGDLALIGIEETGEMTRFVGTRKEVTESPDIEKLANDTYRFNLSTTHQGWSGILMLTGKGPFDPALLSGKSATRGPDWPARFLKMARERGWQAEMVWYRTVDELPNG